ncbi:MAG TPA: flagellar biosynthesis regulatory protein FlaF [Devosia sp.]|nr:flagellar biosynthesis regulatory protein FlaF [Devosia sp.]
MQNQAAAAYQQVAKQTANPTDREADLLSQSAQRLQKIRADWDGNYADLAQALKFTNNLWGILLAAVVDENNPLPDHIRQNVANLGIFILSRIVEIQLEPAPQKLDAIININRELAAGLRTNPGK